MRFKFWQFPALIIGCLLPLSTLASSVSAIKGKQVVITMDSETYNVGEVIYGMTGSKKTALIQIQKVKGNKALGTITRGHVAVGGKTMIRQASSARTAKASGSEDEYGRSSATSRRKKKAMGFLIGYASQSTNMTLQTSPAVSESVKLTGSALSFKGFMDIDYTQTITIRLAAGLEPLNTKGNSSLGLCDNGTSSSCTFNYNFIALEGSAHYNFVNAASRYWAGIGYAFLLDGGHKNNTPNVTLAGSSSQMILLSAGGDIGVGNKGSFIPLVVEYGIFPGGGGVTINSIFARAGYGWSF